MPTKTFLHVNLSLLAAVSFAATAQDQNLQKNVKLETMVVTATRTPLQLPQALASVTMLERSDIDRLQVNSLPELLTRVAGINIAQNGGEGSVSSIFIRGAESNHTLVLIDGVRSNSATIGSTAAQYLSTDQIERIEIVRGPRSSLYGSDAIGGVIQIFTRQGSKKNHTAITVGAGSNTTSKVSASTSLSTDTTQFNIAASYYDTQGFSRKADPVSPPDDDDDAYRNASASASISHQLNDDNVLSLRVSRNQGQSEYDGFGPLYSEFAMTSINGSLKTQLTGSWNSIIQLGHFVDDSKSLSEDPGYLWNSEIETTRQSASWQNDFTIAKQQLVTIGADYYKDEVESTTTYAQDSIDDLGIFGQYQAEFTGWDLTAGLRTDDHQAFGSQTTGNIAAGLPFNDSFKLIASYGTAFKAPTLNDLYYDVPFSGKGNANLKPEESESAELELRANNVLFNRWAVSIYRTKISDLIIWETDPNTWFSTPRNINDADIDGADLQIIQAVNALQFNFSYTYLDSKDKTNNRPLARRAEHSANLDIDYQWGNFTLGTSIYGQSKRFDYDYFGNQYKLDGYSTTAIRASYQFMPSIRVQLKIDNIFNKEYVLAQTYNTDGTNAFLSVTYTP